MSTVFYLKENDTRPIMYVTLKDPSGSSVDLTGASADIHVTQPDKTISIDAAATIANATGGVVYYTFDGTLTAGNYLFEIEVTYPSGLVETFPNIGYGSIVVAKELA